MIFLNSHVKGISWLVSVEASHKILPTLYVIQGNTAFGDLDIIKMWWEDEAKN